MLLTGAITVAHFLISPDLMFWHNLLRRAYYLPIVWAVYLSGLRGGAIVSSVVAAIFAIHLLTGWGHHLRSQMDQVYDIVGLLAVGVGVGYVVDRSRKAAVISAQREWDGELRRLISASVHDLKSPVASTQELCDSLLRENKLGTWEHSIGVRLQRTVRRLTDVRHDLVGASRILLDRALLTETGAWTQRFVSDSHLGGLHGSIRVKIDTVSPPPSRWPVPPAALDELVRCLIDQIHGDGVVPKEGEMTLSGSATSFVLEYRADSGRQARPASSMWTYSSSQLRERLIEVLLRRVNGTLANSGSNGTRGFRVELQRSGLRIGPSGSASGSFPVDLTGDSP
ncbi:MAG: hypothetical protein HY304_02135 [candidate division Zixibacteria bacterium]|nr:hypothetical protein [candidate division Zixibacteria bacterium]